MTNCNQCPQVKECESCSLIVNAEGPVTGKSMTEQVKFEAAWLNFTYVDMRQCAEYFWKACAEPKDKDIAELQAQLFALNTDKNNESVRVAELREKLATATTENECLSASCKAVTEKLALRQATVEKYSIDIVDDSELTAIKSAELQAGWQQGYDEGAKVHDAQLQSAYKAGKRAARAELEKELMEQGILPNTK